MKFFKNRTVAIILCALIVIGSTLLNTHWKLGGLCRELSDRFYASDEIGQQLETLRVEAVTLAAVAEGNGLDAFDLTGAAENLQDHLSRGGAASVYAAYDWLRTELAVTEQKLLSKALSEGDAETVSLSLEKIHAAQAKLAASSYNEDVRDFLRRYDRFPTSMLARLAGVALPEVFA